MKTNNFYDFPKVSKNIFKVKRKRNSLKSVISTSFSVSFVKDSARLSSILDESCREMSKKRENKTRLKWIFKFSEVSVLCFYELYSHLLTIQSGELEEN